jgi:hypothetical protein
VGKVIKSLKILAKSTLLMIMLAKVSQEMQQTILKYHVILFEKLGSKQKHQSLLYCLFVVRISAQLYVALDFMKLDKTSIV